MARQILWTLAACAFLLGAVPAAAGHSGSQRERDAHQGQKSSRDDRREYREPFENHPRYPWWKDDKVIAAAGFTPEQSSEIDRIVRETLEKTRPLREEVMKLQKSLNEMIDGNVADVAVFARQVDTVETKRAELNKLRLVMLYRMHRVLSPEQHAKLLAYFERREAERRKQDATRRR